MNLHQRKGPLADSYAGAAALVIFGLIPYLVLTSAISPLEDTISKSVHLSAQALSLTSGMANAGYAFGTVLAVQLSLRTRPRRLLLLYTSLLLAGSILAASSPTPGLFIAGHIVQGFCTSLMLIAALPPLILGYPVSKLPITAGLMNLCIFGAVALGPVVGGVLAGSGDWRLLFYLAAASALAAWLLVILTWEDDEPMGHHPWDPASIILAGSGTSAAFFGASQLTTHAMLSPIVIIPLLGGIAAIICLVLRQVLSENPLVPVLNLVSAKPVFGVVAAIAAGAASIPAVSLASEAVSKQSPPGHIASLFWPFFGMAIIVALLFGLVLKTRLMIPLVVSGLTMLAGGIAVLTGVQHGPHELIAFGSGMVGFGVGASVAPALFVAGYSVRVIYIQRVLALVELFRAVAAFMTGPILLHLAMTVDGGLSGSGLKTALWVSFAIAAGGDAIALWVLLSSRVHLQRPDIEAWQEDEAPAWVSPPLGAGLHGGGFRDQVREAQRDRRARGSFEAPEPG